jgi:hypothetical protein
MFSTLMTVYAYACDGVRPATGRCVTSVVTGGRPAPRDRTGRGWRGTFRGLLAGALVLVSGAAYPHSWYPHDCCHDGDCHPVPCDELVETRNGIMWRGVVLFNDAQVKASQDQFCHVCAKEQKGSSILPYLPICAFIQPSS